MPNPPVTSGRLDAIWLKPAHREPMRGSETARLVPGEGIDGNADRGGRRQVTLIQREVWETLRAELGPDLPFTARRANLLVSGVALAHTTGRSLVIGGTRIRIEGETRPCGRMDQEFPGLQTALIPDWRAGAYGVVVDGGPIAVGDAVRWEDEPMHPLRTRQKREGSGS